MKNIRKGFQRLVKWIGGSLDDILGLAGAGLIVYGTWAVRPDLTPFVAGGFLLVAAVLNGLAFDGQAAGAKK